MRKRKRREDWGHHGHRVAQEDFGYVPVPVSAGGGVLVLVRARGQPRAGSEWGRPCNRANEEGTGLSSSRAFLIGWRILCGLLAQKPRLPKGPPAGAEVFLTYLGDLETQNTSRQGPCLSGLRGRET